MAIPEAPGKAPQLTVQRVEAAIVDLEARLLQTPYQPADAIARAQLLELLGRRDEAVQGYVAVLARDPTHVEALNALGLLCLSAGNRAAARTLLCGAVLHGPRHAAAHANLAYLYVLDEHLSGARELYQRALELDPESALAHHGFADLLERTGDLGRAAEHRARGLRRRPITLRRYRGEGRPVRVLALGSAALGNVATDAFLDDRVFAVASLVVEYDDPATPLPPHDLVFNVIGEGDLCGAQLAVAAAIAARSGAPVINPPNAVAATARAANAARLRALDGVVTPHIATFARAQLQAASGPALLAKRGFTFPLLVRSPGFHTGDHFVKVEAAGDLAAAIADLPGDELLVIEFFDLRDGHGIVRKYRAIVVDGTLYPLHLALSTEWKIHYFRADMAGNDAHRREDERFLTDMRAAIGPAAYAALERVRDALGLDYGGIDFALNSAGNAIVFEANASMIVPMPENGEQWDYRRPAVERIHAAVRAMLVRRARSA